MNQQLVKRSAETVLFDFNCAPIMGAGETILAITNMAATGPGAALTFGDAVVNTAPIGYPFGQIVPARKVIQVLIGGGTASTMNDPRAYTVRIRFTTSNAGEVREATARLLVIDEV
jgi:hypothetical protein